MIEPRRPPQAGTSEEVRMIDRRRPQQETDNDDDRRGPFSFFGGREREREDVRPRPLFRLFGEQD